MSGGFNERLSIAKTRLREHERLSAMLRVVRRSMSEAKRDKKKLGSILEKEESDVRALEGMTITGLFHTVLGSKKELLKKERQEFLAAKLKFDQSSETVEDLIAEVNRLMDDLKTLEDAESNYENVLEEKAAHLKSAGNDTAKKIIALTEQIAGLEADQKELKEAVRAGQSARSAIQEIERSLDSAANWGTVDMFGGGGITTLIKHSKMDDAKDQARKAQRELLRFQVELADADQRLQVSLEIGGLSKFADFFFDGLIADWMVQSKINAAKSECDKTLSSVVSAVAQCERQLESVIDQVNGLVSEKQALIENA